MPRDFDRYDYPDTTRSILTRMSHLRAILALTEMQNARSACLLVSVVTLVSCGGSAVLVHSADGGSGGGAGMNAPTGGVVQTAGNASGGASATQGGSAPTGGTDAGGAMTGGGTGTTGGSPGTAGS